jgi:acetolactate synthase-1/2/3 large subunit
MMNDKMEIMNGGKALMKALEKEGVKQVFGLPGGANLPMYDELYKSNIRHILVRHEQSAAHMADGFGRVSRKPGVCFATSGPGATNLLTGIATAQADSAPMVAVTGQVNKFVAPGPDVAKQTPGFLLTLPKPSAICAADCSCLTSI